MLLLVVISSSAEANTSVEGIWSFNGGQIAIQPEGDGKFEGVVVQPTQFATCVHPVGQKIWKEMTPEPDGSYQGFHQWYNTESCTENPNLGPTAWRVVAAANGSNYLRVCLSDPGTPAPAIPVNSAGIDASFGCQSSALTAALAATNVGGFKSVVSLPSSRKCLSARKFAIHIRNPKYDPFKTIAVTLKEHKLAVARRGNYYVATVSLKGLPRGAFRVTIEGETYRGHRLSGHRTYHTCAVVAKRHKPRRHRS